MKKFLSLVLALVMTMSLVTVSAGAKDFADSDKIQYTEAVDVMSAVKVIDGYTDGSFNPTATLTRGAAAKIICNLILGPTTAGALVADAAPYKDVPTNHTFAGYIAYCQKEGIISGYADGTFRPANSLTGYAFMKMLLGALGYDAKVEGYTGPNWSVNVAKRALNIGLADELVGNFNGVKAVNREEACLYALNTMTANMVEYDAKTSVSAGDTTVVIAGSKAKDMENKNRSTDGNVFTADGVMQFAEKYFDNLTVKKGSDDFSRPSNVWKIKAEEIGTYTDTPDASYTAKVEVGDIYKALGLGKTIAAKQVSVYVDGVTDKTQPAYALTKGDDQHKYGGNGVLTEVFYNKDNDSVTITEINTYVGTIAKTVKATDKKDAYVVVTPEKPISGTAPMSGNEEFETDEKFEDEAYVLYTYSKIGKGEIKSVELAKQIVGTVTLAENDKQNTADAKALTIDGTRYKDSKYVAGDKLSDVSVKKDYTIYLDAYGYMIYVEENEEIGDYALVLATAIKSDFVGKKAELLFTDGTTKVVTTEKNYNGKIADNRIVTFKVDADGVYTLREVDRAKASYYDNDAGFALKNDKAGIMITKDPAGVNKDIVTANSATVFVVRDTEDTDDYTAYTGIKNAPTMTASNAAGNQASVYLYCKTGKMTTVAFIMPGANMDVDDESNNTLYIASESASNLQHDSEGDYYIFNAVVNGEIKTVKVDSNVQIDTNGHLSNPDAKKVDGLFKGYSTDKHGVITRLRTYDDYATNVPASKPGDKKEAFVGVGIDKTSKEYTVILNTDGKTLVPNSGENYITYTSVNSYSVKNETITCSDNAKFYYVDKDGKIETSSYNGIAVDSNDIVYAVVKDFMVQSLFVREIPEGSVNGQDHSGADGLFSYRSSNFKGWGVVNYTVTTPEYAASGASVSATVVIKANGETIATDNVAPFAATNGQYNGSWNGFVFDEDATITAEIKGGKPSVTAAAVKYVDGATDEVLYLDSWKNSADVDTGKFAAAPTSTLSTGSAAQLGFTVKTDDTTAGLLSYSISGLAAGNVKDEDKIPLAGAANAAKTIPAAAQKAEGDQFVVVKIFGLDNLTEKLDITVADSLAAAKAAAVDHYDTATSAVVNATATTMDKFGVTGATTDNVKVEFTNGTTGGQVHDIAKGIKVQVKVTVTAGTDAAAYDVSVKVSGKEYKDGDWITVDKDLVVEGITVTVKTHNLALVTNAAGKYDKANIAADGKSMTVCFNEKVTNATAGKKAEDAITTSTVGLAIVTKELNADGKSVTLTFNRPLVNNDVIDIANDLIGGGIATNKLGAAKTITIVEAAGVYSDATV